MCTIQPTLDKIPDAYLSTILTQVNSSYGSTKVTVYNCVRNWESESPRVYTILSPNTLHFILCMSIATTRWVGPCVQLASICLVIKYTALCIIVDVSSAQRCYFR